MKFSTKARYALLGMIQLARKKGAISLKEIAKRESLSHDYLERIFLKLKKAGLVSSKKGKKGGYFLKKSPEEIKISDIIKAVDEKITPVFCIEERKKYTCPKEKRCLAKIFWQEVKKKIEESLDSVTLWDIISKERKRKKL